jgi:ketosteroid isomerase-like protein
MNPDKEQCVATTEAVRSLFAAYLAKDRSKAEALLADDFSFTSPWDDHIGRAQYFEKCWPHGVDFQDIRILKLIADGNEAFATYEAETEEGAVFRNTEFFHTNGTQVVSIDVYFGRTLKEGSEK